MYKIWVIYSLVWLTEFNVGLIYVLTSLYCTVVCNALFDESSLGSMRNSPGGYENRFILEPSENFESYQIGISWYCIA